MDPSSQWPARNRGTRSGGLDSLRGEVTRELTARGTIPPGTNARLAPRVDVKSPARLCLGDLVLDGTLENVSVTGTLFKTGVIVEVGERGALQVELDLSDGQNTPVRVVWNRLDLQAQAVGLGLVFETGDPAVEKQVLLMLQRLLAKSTGSAS